jgi:hypothetical protein
VGGVVVGLHGEMGGEVVGGGYIPKLFSLFSDDWGVILFMGVGRMYTMFYLVVS